MQALFNDVLGEAWDGQSLLTLDSDSVDGETEWGGVTASGTPFSLCGTILSRGSFETVTAYLLDGVVHGPVGSAATTAMIYQWPGGLVVVPQAHRPELVAPLPEEPPAAPEPLAEPLWENEPLPDTFGLGKVVARECEDCIENAQRDAARARAIAIEKIRLARETRDAAIEQARRDFEEKLIDIALEYLKEIGQIGETLVDCLRGLDCPIPDMFPFPGNPWPGFPDDFDPTKLFWI
jgi:hypothetical protein